MTEFVGVQSLEYKLYFNFVYIKYNLTILQQPWMWLIQSDKAGTSLFVLKY